MLRPTSTYPLSGFYSMDNYAPFGTKSASSATSYLTLKPTGSTVSLRDGFTGQEDQSPDFTIGYIDFGARQYNPTLSRWLVPDPMGEKYYDVSPYAYCNNDPVRFVDPTGEIWYSINSEGHITVVDSEKEGPDRLYSKFDWRNNETDYIQISNNSFLKNLVYNPEAEKGKVYYSQSKEADDIFSVFKFVADHSNTLSTATSVGRRTLCPYFAMMSLAAWRFSGVSSSLRISVDASPSSMPLARRNALPASPTSMTVSAIFVPRTWSIISDASPNFAPPRMKTEGLLGSSKIAFNANISLAISLPEAEGTLSGNPTSEHCDLWAAPNASQT